MFPELDILKENYTAAKITVIEGPDASGKSSLIKELVEVFKYKDCELRVIRLPGNHGPNVMFRDMILSDEIKNNPMCQQLLFTAEMLYVFESQIKPYLNDDKVKFVFDRFLPSTIVYQKKSLYEINRFFEGYEEFTSCFKEAHYIYLSPQSFEIHKERILQKQKDNDTNHFDPVSDEEIKENSRSYYELSRLHKKIGLLGSKHVSIHIV